MSEPLFPNLPTLAEQRVKPDAPAKTYRVAEKQARQQSKDDQAEAFRTAVWARDKHRSRATGKKLTRVHPKQRGAGLIPWSEIGEVDHSYPRSTHPELIYSVQHGILLSKEENRWRKVPCARAPELRRFDYTGPDDRSQPQHFIWRDDDGKVTKETRG